MPDTPLNPQTPKPLDPIAPWLREMVKDKPAAKPEVVAPVVPEVTAPVVEEKPAVASEAVVPAAEVAPVVTPVAPAVSTPPVTNH